MKICLFLSQNNPQYKVLEHQRRSCEIKNGHYFVNMTPHENECFAYIFQTEHFFIANAT